MMAQARTVNEVKLSPGINHDISDLLWLSWPCCTLVKGLAQTTAYGLQQNLPNLLTFADDGYGNVPRVMW